MLVCLAEDRKKPICATVIRVIQRKQCTFWRGLGNHCNKRSAVSRKCLVPKLEWSSALDNTVTYTNEALKSTLVPKSFCCRVTLIQTTSTIYTVSLSNKAVENTVFKTRSSESTTKKKKVPWHKDVLMCVMRTTFHSSHPLSKGESLWSPSLRRFQSICNNSQQRLLFTLLCCKKVHYLYKNSRRLYKIKSLGAGLLFHLIRHNFLRLFLMNSVHQPCCS